MPDSQLYHLSLCLFKYQSDYFNDLNVKGSFHFISYFYSTTKHEILQIKKSQLTI